MDTTYWGLSFVLMVIKDSLRKEIYCGPMSHETVAGYMESICCKATPKMSYRLELIKLRF